MSRKDAVFGGYSSSCLVSKNQTFMVTPSDDVNLTIASPDDTSDDRVYTVENAVVGAEHQIVLAAAANVTVDANGIVTFEEAGTLNEADFGTVMSDITVVNGVPTSGTVQTAAITPTTDSFTFRVDGDADET